MSLHVGVNAHLLSRGGGYRQAGVSGYIYHLLSHLWTVEPEVRWTLFVPPGLSRAASGAPPHVALHHSALPTFRPVPRIVWEQLVAPMEFARRGVDVVLCPVNVVPLLTDCPTVVTIHDVAFLRHAVHPFLKRRYLATFTRASARRAARIITVSEFTRREVLELLDVPPEHVIAIPNGRDERFQPLADDAVEAFRRCSGLPPRFLLFIGTLEPRKNLTTLIRAYARVKAKLGIPLLIGGGKGWHYDQIFGLVRELKLERDVRFLGFVPDEQLPQYYAAATAFVYPSVYEGFGLPPLEALGAGTPVVTSDAQSIVEVVADAALTVPSLDVAAWADALLRVTDDAELRAQLRSRGLARARRFCWESSAASVMGVLREAAQNGSAPRTHLVAPRQAVAPATLPRTKRILFLDHTAKLGGGEAAMLNLIRHLDRSRFEPLVLLFSHGELVRRLREDGTPVHVLPLARTVLDIRKDTMGGGTLLRLGDLIASMQYIRRLRRFILESGADLVHTNSLKSDVIGGLAARLAGKPLIWHIRDRIEDDYLPAPVVHVFRWLCRVLPDALIANSAATLRTLHLARHDRGEAIHSGIELDRTRVVHDGMGSIQPALIGEPPSVAGRRVGLVGRISPWKGQHVFLEAAALVLHRFPEARFQVIGAALFQEQAYEREVRQLARDLGLDDHVEFTGFRDDVSQLISQLEVLVHASTTGEPFGQAIVEGMAAGKPVVATAGGGVPEIVIDGVTGLLVPMGDAESMAAAICRLLEDPVVARQMGSLGRQRARQQFTIDQTASKVQSLYEEMLEHRPVASLSAATDDRPARAPATDQTGTRVARGLRSLLAPACVTFVAVSAALAVTRLLQNALGLHAPISAPFLAAVAVSAGLYGHRAGLASVGLSALALAYFVFPPHHSMAIDKLAQPAFITFVVVGLLITWLSGMLHEANARVESSRNQVEEARRGLDFVAKVAASLSIESTTEGLLRAIGYLAVTNLCDWCAIDLVESDGAMFRAWASHRNVKLGRFDAACRGPLTYSGTSNPSVQVIQSGSPILLSSAACAQYFARAELFGCQPELRQVRWRSMMVVPLAAAGRIMGAITFASADVTYRSRNLKLATEFAWRSALALERADSLPARA